MHLIHGWRWNNKQKLMTNPVPAGEAKASYESGGEVSIACGRVPLEGYALDSGKERPADPEPAEWVIYADLDRGYVQVDFFSFFGTREATYAFQRQPDGRLFLDGVSEYDFAHRTPETSDREWVTFESHTFEPDGTSRKVIRTKAAGGGQNVQLTEYRGGDVNSHWEPVPTFGEWESITRRQR